MARWYVKDWGYGDEQQSLKPFSQNAVVRKTGTNKHMHLYL